MQDLPYLVLRLLLIFKYGVLSYTNMFFTCKNTIVIMLLIYRLIVVQFERKRKGQGDSDERYYQMSDSSSKSKLLAVTPNGQKVNYKSTTPVSSNNWFDYKSEVNIKEVEDDPNEPVVRYVLKPHIEPCRRWDATVNSVGGFANNVTEYQNINIKNGES